ncbi:hypothetical protein ACFONL_13650 [Camelimonas fluminis]|uniref:Uncharacterized protein n=1 Tax=Camelimonas fluminis TaxID=1576911 RepID=A0ABV7UI86_9HYPH|nr:hypothetical protein [Camelimonas fluminis]
MKTASAMLSGARIAGFAAIAGVLMAASGAMAAPAGAGAGVLGGEGAPMVSTVAGGCGHGMYRGPGGRCYRAAGPHAHRPPPPPPRHYHAPRRAPHCVVQHTPHGPRRICR